MELIQAIALLCQLSTGSDSQSYTERSQLKCQQYYVHCVSTKRSTSDPILSIERCILEKK